jgi:hypothetical protein
MGQDVQKVVATDSKDVQLHWGIFSAVFVRWPNCLQAVVSLPDFDYRAINVAIVTHERVVGD